MKWTKEIPKKVGTYFKNNPPTSHITRQNIFDIDGVLWISCKQGAADKVATPLHHWDCAGLWWFGPIPQVPNSDLPIDTAV